VKRLPPNTPLQPTSAAGWYQLMEILAGGARG
jgi:hypothetical protein